MIRTLAFVQTAGIALLVAGSASAQCPDCDNGSSQAQGWQSSGSPYPGGSGYVDSGYCMHCYDDECESDGRCPCRCLCEGKACPTSGWLPPARLPVNRNGIWYRNYWPQAWYGNPGGGFIADAPTVYQPTDTTQLGYSYARVPTWRSVRMIPPTPCPSYYHARVCVPRPKCSRIIDGCPTADPCQYGGGNCPSCQQDYAANWTVPGVPADGNTPVHAIHTVSRPTPQQSARRRKGTFTLTSLLSLFD